MEDGPKLLPQWLRGSSSALHNKGDTFDASKRGKPAGGPDSARSGAPTDPWLSRGGSAGPPLNSVSGTASGKVPQEFSRTSDRGALGDRSWKARDHGYTSSNSRSGYVPAGLKPNGRDDRDRDVISLKPGGGYSAGRSYSRSGEPEGGGGGTSGRLDRGGQDGWQLPRTTSTGGGLGGGRRDEDDTRSPLRMGVVANGGASAGPESAAPSKASFETDFPSLRPSSSAAPGAGPVASPSPPGGALSAAVSAPQLGASSPLLDTASSGNVLAPYRQTFLSSRTSSNWTSKLAEAPAAPSISPSSTPSSSLSQHIPANNPIEDEGLAPPQAASTPSPSPSPPPVAASTPAAAVGSAATPISAPVAPVPVVPPRPSGVWGTPAAAAAVAAAAAESNISVSAAAGAPIPTTRARMEHLAVRQSKQLIPVISSGTGKPKSGGVGGVGGGGMQGLGMGSGGAAGTGGVGGGVGGSRGVGGVPKPVVPAPGLLKMSAGKRDETGAGSGPAAAGARVLASSTVILSKKASQPLDRPLTLTRTASASAPTAPLAPAAGGTATGSAAPGGESGSSGVASGESVGASRAQAQAAAEDALASRQPHAVNCETSSGLGSAQVATGAPPVLVPGLVVTPPPQQVGPAPPPHEQQQQQHGPPSSSATHPALQVSEEEEAFLRSLGWTGFDEEDGDGEDTGLTEEEIAAFRAEQQRQQAAAAAAAVAAGPLAAAAAAPKPVPALAVRRRGKPLIVAASYGSEQVSSSTDSDSECE